MMRRFYKRLIAILLTAIFSLVGIWLTLPSPSNLVDKNSGVYQQSVLRSGNVLTTVHQGHVPSQRWGVALDWQLIPDQQHNSISLQVGSFTPINLTDLADPARKSYNARYSGEGRAGQRLDGLNAPWFTSADAVLLFWEIYHESQGLDISVVVQQPGVVEIWSREQSSLCKGDCVWGTLADQLLCTISSIPFDSDRTDISEVVIGDMSNLVPSKTYPIRRFIIQCLVRITPTRDTPIIKHIITPFLIVCASILVGTSELIAILLICILAVGCIVAVQRWLTHGKLTTRRSKVIWGPSGPIDSKNHEDDLDQESQQHGPIPLSRPSDLWRSKSPLDDLLVTFRATAWLTEPMLKRRRSWDTTTNSTDHKD